MKIGYFIRPGMVSGCDMWRLLLPLNAAAEQGHDVTMIRSLNRLTDLDGNTVQMDVVDEGYDVIVFGRTGGDAFVEMSRFLQSSGIKVVVDFDDDFTDVHELNRARQSFTETTVDDFMAGVRAADGVIVTTRFLQQKFQHLNDNMVVIDNYVPENMVRDSVPETEKVIGWAGGVSVHPEDLQEVGSSVAAMVNRHGYRFDHVGDGHVNKILKCPTREYGSKKLFDYLAIINTFNIGLAPLSKSDFNRAKSRLKVLEMSALGVPWVASPRDEYSRVHSEGIGQLAEGSTEWYKAMQRYANDESYRLEQAEKGLEWAKKNTLELNCWKWMDFFDDFA